MGDDRPGAGAGQAASDPPGVPPAGPPARDETANFDEATVVSEGSGQPGLGPAGTSVLPAVPDPTRLDPVRPDPQVQPRWSARARVPTPDLDRADDEVWDDGGGRPPRRGLGPILVLVAVLVLLGVLSLGLWLALRGGDSAPVTSPAESTRQSPTSETTRPRTTTPAATPTTRAMVTIPPLDGREYAEAVEILEDLGLATRRLDRADASVLADHVIGTDPPAGATVLPGPDTTVTIQVSTGGPTASPTPAPPTTAPDRPGTKPSSATPTPATKSSPQLS